MSAHLNKSRRPRWRSLVTVALMTATSCAFGALAAAPAEAQPGYLTVVGDGSSWAANAINQWVSDVASKGMKVVYTSDGSAQGRQNFAGYNNDFAGSDIGYQGVDPLTKAQDLSSRPYAYLPLAAGGTAFPYHIEVGGKRVTNLRLSGTTLAKIFTGQITDWADGAITADNNNVALPHKTIIPVVHSEGAGSTAQFTRYLASTSPSIWSGYLKAQGDDPSVKMTEYYPSSGNMVPQSGSDGIMNYITSSSGDGTIGYDEYSYALGAKYPVAKILNKAGYYTLPTQFNDAVALTAAVINTDPSSTDYLLQNLDGVYVNPAPQTYPLSSYSYGIIPTSATDSKMNSGKRQTLADFLSYSVCAGQAELGPIGYSSLPVNLVNASFGQIQKLSQADPSVSTSATPPTNCNNPTFDAANPSVNKLATIAPIPATCDKVGQGPCTDDTSTGVANKNPVNSTGTGAVGKSATPTPKPGSAAAKAAAAAAAAAAGSAGGASAAAGAAGATATPTPNVAIDPETGLPVDGSSSSDGGSTDASGAQANARALDLAAASRSGSNVPYAVLAVVMLLLALLAPPLLLRMLQNRPGSASTPGAS